MITGLLAVGVVSLAVAVFALAREWSVERVATQTDVHVGRAINLAARFDALLRTFGATRESETSWFGKATTLLGELTNESRALDDLLPGVATGPRGRIAEYVPILSETIERARANAEASRTLMALDVIETNGLPASESLLLEVDGLRTAAGRELTAARRFWRLWFGASLGTWALAWAAGMMALLRRSERQVVPDAIRAPAARAVEHPTVAPAVATTNFQEVATLCQTIAQVRQESDLPGIMQATARLLGGSGVVMWIPQGDALVVGTFHGYASGLPERLGRVSLSEDNLLTQTWHRREPQVARAESGRKGAMVMPILGAAGISGILAVEMPPGSEADAARVAAARLISAQLGAALAAPPSDVTRAQPHEAPDQRVSA